MRCASAWKRRRAASRATAQGSRRRSLGDLIARATPGQRGLAYLTGADVRAGFGAAPDVWRQCPHTLQGNPVGIVQVSGLSYHLDYNAPNGKRVSNVRIMGRPIDPKETYRVAATDYELMPQRGYVPDLDLATVEFDSHTPLREVLRDHFALFTRWCPACARGFCYRSGTIPNGEI